MPVKIIDGYEVEFTAEPLEGCDSWGAYVSIFAPSDNPMHMTVVYPKQRVSADLELSNSVLAETEAEGAALKILESLRT